MAGGAFYTLRQLDQRHGRPKGTAFRAFKRLRPRLAEGADFLRLDAWEEGARIEALRADGVIYPASVHVVLIAAERAAEIGAAMESAQ